MKCPACGYLTLERRTECVRCGASLTGDRGPSAPGAAPPPPGPRDEGGDRPRDTRPEPAAAGPSQAASRRRRGSRGSSAGRTPSAPAPGVEALELGEDELDSLAPARVLSSSGARPAAEFRLDDELLDPPADGPGTGFPGAASAPGPPAAAADRGPRPLFSLDEPDEGSPAPGGAAPIIESDDEVPERFWAPEGARLTRRAAALAVDLALLAGALAIFYAGAFAALTLAGVPAGHLLSAAGAVAALGPLAVLGLLSSLVFDVACHAGSGRTPGKRLLGLEVRTLAGCPPTPGAAVTRWLGAILGLACAGVGVAWALFDPRRRGWADLLSKTVVAERRARRDEEQPPGPAPLTTSGGAGTIRRL